MASLFISRGGYKNLTGGNYYVPSFGYFSIDGAPPFNPTTNSLLLYGRGLDRARSRGTS